MIIVILDLRQPRQNAVPFTQCGIRGFGDDQHRRLIALTMPFHRFCKQIALRVRSCHHQHGYRRQTVRVLIAALALFQMPFGFQFLEHTLEVDAGRTLDAKGLGDVALGGLGRVLFDPFKDLGFGGDVAHD